MTKQTKLNLSLVLPFAFLLAPHALALGAQDECMSDADCEDGSACEMSYQSPACDGDSPNGSSCEDTVEVTGTGYCVVQPQTCEADSDCGEYQGCVSSDSGSCWASSNGESGCDEPDPDAPKYCAPKHEECSQDSDCPREFECVQNVVCPEIDACFDESCEKPACETSEVGECVPKQIECDDSSVCPSDWSCIQGVEYTCDGGDVTDNGGSSDGGPPEGSGTNSSEEETDPEPAAERDIAPEPEACVTIETQGYCRPDAWGYDGYSYDLATGGYVERDDGGIPTTDTAQPDRPTGDSDATSSGNESASADEGGSGCTVSSHGPSHSGAWGWLLLLGLPFFRRRRANSVEAR